MWPPAVPAVEPSLPAYSAVTAIPSAALQLLGVTSAAAATVSFFEAGHCIALLGTRTGSRSRAAFALLPPHSHSIQQLEFASRLAREPDLQGPLLRCACCCEQEGSSLALVQAVSAELKLGRMDANTATTILGSLLPPQALLQLVSMLRGPPGVQPPGAGARQPGVQSGLPAACAAREGSPSPWHQAWLSSGGVPDSDPPAPMGHGWGHALF
jgi:hypothetical protein